MYFKISIYLKKTMLRENLFAKYEWRIGGTNKKILEKETLISTMKMISTLTLSAILMDINILFMILKFVLLVLYLRTINNRVVPVKRSNRGYLCKIHVCKIIYLTMFKMHESI